MVRGLNFLNKYLFFNNICFRHRNASMLFVDNPVGAGFSFTGNSSGYPHFVNEVFLFPTLFFRKMTKKL